MAWNTIREKSFSSTYTHNLTEKELNGIHTYTNKTIFKDSSYPSLYHSGKQTMDEKHDCATVRDVSPSKCLLLDFTWVWETAGGVGHNQKKINLFSEYRFQYI